MFFIHDSSAHRPSAFFLASASISTLIICIPHLSAKARQSSRRIMLPSGLSFTSSHSTPACGSPVRRQRSTPDSVCPLRVRTPPSRARKGTTCPGSRKSAGVTVGEARARAVSALSWADIPVVVPIYSYEPKGRYGQDSVLTMFVVGRYGIGSPMAVLIVVRDHHRKFQLCYSFRSECNADITTAQVISEEQSHFFQPETHTLYA